MDNYPSGDPQLSLKDNPFVPPKVTCPVNNIPPEVLSLIFEIGARSIEDGEDSDDEDEAMATFWNLEEGVEDDVLNEEDSVTRRLGRSKVTGNDGDESQYDGISESASDSTFEVAPPFEVLISHVCQHWRTVALNTPSLWTKINVSPLESAPFERVKILLERGKSLPIDIHIDCEPPDDDDESSCGSEDSELDQSPHSMSFSDLDSLMSLLVPHISRWGSIEVSVSCYKHMFVFLSAVSDPSIAGAPQLEALQLYHHEDAESLTAFAHPDLVQHFKLFGGVAPRLKSVALWGVHVDWCQEWLSSGSNLLDLELAYHTDDVRPSWTQFVGILRGAPKLETLSLCSSGPLGAPHDWYSEGGLESHGDDHSGVIGLRSLTDLVLAFHSPVYVSGLIHRLALPALKSLTLDFDDDDFTDVVAQLAGPATTAVPPQDGEKMHSLLSGLETLKISGLPCSDRSVELMYKELGNLKALNLSMTYLSPAFIQLLYYPYSVSGRREVWLPSLTTLSTADVPGDQMMELVRKRKEAGVPLKAVFMEENDAVTEEDIQWLKENLETFDFFEGSDDEFEPLPDIEEEQDGSESEWEEVDD